MKKFFLMIALALALMALAISCKEPPLDMGLIWDQGNWNQKNWQ